MRKYFSLPLEVKKLLTNLMHDEIDHKIGISKFFSRERLKFIILFLLLGIKARMRKFFNILSMCSRPLTHLPMNYFYISSLDNRLLENCEGSSLWDSV